MFVARGRVVGRVAVACWPLLAVGCGSDDGTDDVECGVGCLEEVAPGTFVSSDETALRQLIECPRVVPERWFHSVTFDGEPPEAVAEWQALFADGLDWAASDLSCPQVSLGLGERRDGVERIRWLGFDGPPHDGHSIRVRYRLGENASGDTEAGIDISVVGAGLDAELHGQRFCDVHRQTSEPIAVVVRQQGRATIELRAAHIEGTCEDRWIRGFSASAIIPWAEWAEPAQP